MEDLIPVVNRLQDVLTSVGVETGIDLPQIAVVGAQSVGKTSVLESIVGRDFLPRGSGIVTRRPLILQLRNIELLKKNESQEAPSRTLTEGSTASVAGESGSLEQHSSEEWGEFGHQPGKRYEDFSAIRQEIVKETERLVGTAKQISPHPITLKIFSPHVIDLTLVDLPGITKVPVGDQPADIELQIRRLIYQYISRPNCIILAITAANTDIANSDALKFGREVDPDGVRTIGVLTKCDLMDEGTDAMETLQGKLYPLRRGHVAVVCRSQKDIADKRGLREALKSEKTFFTKHPAYVSIAHKCGTKYLATLLNQIFLQHIRESLPELKQRIQSLIHSHEDDLAAFGDSLLEPINNPGALLLHFFSKFARNFQEAIEGPLATQQLASQLQGGARLNYIFHDWFGKALQDFDPLSGLTDHEIRTSIRNATGPKAALFVPEGAFEILVKKQIAKLEPPALRCVDQVYEELQKILELCELAELSRYENLRERLFEVVNGVLKKQLVPTNQMIQHLIQIELAYINTNHPDFFSNPPPGHSNSGGEDLHKTTRHPGSPVQLSNTAQHQTSTATTTSPAYPSPRENVMHQQQSRGVSETASQSGAAERDKVPPTQHLLAPLHPSLGTYRMPGYGFWAPRGGSGQQNSRGDYGDIQQQTQQQNAGHLRSFSSDGKRPQQQRHNSTPGDPTAMSAAFQGSLGTSHESLAFPSSEAEEQTERTTDRMTQSMYPSYPSPATERPPSLEGVVAPIPIPLAPEPHNTELPIPSSRPQMQAWQHRGVHFNEGTFSATPPAPGKIRLPQVPLIVRATGPLTDRERMETELIKGLIASYFTIVRKNIADSVPKAVMFFMVNQAKDCIHRELVAQLYKEELFDELLQEAEGVAENRQRCKDMLRTLRRALDIVSQIKEA